MDGINAADGKRLGGIDHLRQSIRDILTTPVGTRVGRRLYGSNLFQLTDRPMNRFTLLQLYAATATALRTWEPRLRLTRVQCTDGTPGNITLDVTGDYLPNGQRVTLSGVVVS